MSAEQALDRPVAELARLIAEGDVRAVDVTEAALARVRDRDGRLGAFLNVQGEHALDAARAVDEKRSRGQRLGRLAGVPIGLKDALCTIDAPTTAGSKILTRDPALGAASGWLPPFDATVVSRLRDADAVLPGKCNMDEFAMGSSSENGAFGPVRNPWDPTRTPGGSSGGSAVAVAAGMTPAALGSDTGGSIRQPASFTGVVGVKPTYGRVSRFGLVAFASSLDQVGTFATDVRGAARVLEVIAGYDPRDATSAGSPVDEFEAACGRPVDGLRVGVPEEYFASGTDARVEVVVRSALRGLESLGCTLVPVRLSKTRFAVSTYYLLACAEASSNLARFDGVRFGLRPGKPKDLTSLYETARTEGFGREVKRRIMLGTFVLSAGYYDAYYVKAQRARTRIRRDFDEVFREVDALAAPVSPVVAWKLGEKIDDPLSMYLADVLTLPASLAGLPALSVPAGFAPAADGVTLPVGLQLIGPAFYEARLFSLAAAWERIAPDPPRRVVW